MGHRGVGGQLSGLTTGKLQTLSTPSTMATGDLVLITGATGFVGFRTLLEVLRAGHRARAAVRSAASFEKVIAAASIRELAPSPEQLSMVVVPDMTAPHAYDEAVRGAAYILHMASPVPAFDGSGAKQQWGDDDEAFVRPAIAGVEEMLSSASREPSVKRVVITSSVVGIVPVPYFAGEGEPRDEPFTADSRIPNMTPPYPPGRAYAASKIAALNATDAWVKANKPSFDVINFMPLWVWGRDELSRSSARLRQTSNSFILNLLTGNKATHKINSGAVAVDDVAKAQVLALRESVAGNQSFILGRREDLDSAKGIARRRFPEAAEKGVFREDGEQPVVKLPLDLEKTERVLGFEYMPFEELVAAVGGQYWELLQEEQKGSQ